MSVLLVLPLWVGRAIGADLAGTAQYIEDAGLVRIEALARIFYNRFPGLVGACHGIVRDFSQISGTDQLLQRLGCFQLVAGVVIDDRS